ncbi:MAG: hypothetical protein IPP09_05780 [Elusimicrobia bacterium]|nr:hypothetical protein [Elusimicrobiota bacterium]
MFNTGRAALLASALLSGRRDLLAVAMDDRLHQPYRKALIPGFAGVLKSATAAGAHGAALSGAGPTILALAPAVRGAAQVCGQWIAAFRRRGPGDGQKF